MKQISIGPICAPVLLISLFAMGQSPDSSYFSRPYYAAALCSYNARAGHVDMPIKETSVSVARPNLLTFGITGGVRLPLTRLLRLQIGLAFDAGNSTADTLYTAQTSLDKYFYYHGSLEPSLHCALVPPTWRAVPFLTVGAGLNAVWVNERTFFANNTAQEVIYTDRYYVNQLSWAASASAGLGMDVRLTRKVGLSLVSTFRWLYPVSYNEQEDFPLYAMRYTETLYGNVTWLGVTIRM
jgi:hypothetical protein